MVRVNKKLCLIGRTVRQHCTEPNYVVLWTVVQLLIEKLLTYRGRHETGTYLTYLNLEPLSYIVFDFSKR